MKKIKWEQMRPDEFVAARDARPVAYLAIGPLEWHSLHLPLGVDPLKAYHHICSVAERIGGVVYPPLYFAADAANRDDLPLRSEAYGGELFERVVEAKLDFIASNGFKVILVISGHGGHLDAVRAVAGRIAEKHGIRVYATQDEMHCGPELYAGDHAGGEETSMMLHIAPDLVDLSKLPPRGEPLDTAKLVIHSPKPDPRVQSSAGYGRESCEAITADLARIVEELLAGKDVRQSGGK